MIEKRTIVDQREITANSIIQIRFRKEIVEDGKVLSFQYHRTTLQPGDDLDAQMAVVNAHLERMDCKPVEDYESVKRIVVAEHTKEVIQKFKDNRGAKK